MSGRVAAGRLRPLITLAHPSPPPPFSAPAPSPSLSGSVSGRVPAGRLRPLITADGRRHPPPDSRRQTRLKQQQHLGYQDRPSGGGAHWNPGERPGVDLMKWTDTQSQEARGEGAKPLRKVRQVLWQAPWPLCLVAPHFNAHLKWPDTQG